MVDIKNILQEQLWQLLTNWEITLPKPMFGIQVIKGVEIIPMVLQFAVIVSIAIMTVLFFSWMASELRS